MVCAGTGCGKSIAVRDFTQKIPQQSPADTIWVQLSASDNNAVAFWDNYTCSMMPNNASFAREIHKLGFPGTANKLDQYMKIARNQTGIKQQIVVMDNFHFVENPAVIRFVDCAFFDLPPGNSLFLLSRSAPRIKSAALISRGCIFNMNEEDLRFTGNELDRYFCQMGIQLPPCSLFDIMQDTGGWAFAINLIAQFCRRMPGNGGYMRNVVKASIFRQMETEVWNGISQKLKNFLIRLSLTNHPSVDLGSLLAGADAELLAELERQNAYLRRDNYINAYFIHPLFLEFLAGKKELLPREEMRETCAIAGNWCREKGFKIDALEYFKKIGDYETIVSIFRELPVQFPLDIAHYAAGIFDQIPEEVFGRVDFLAVMHVRTVMCQGLLNDAFNLAEFYEGKYLGMPVENPVREHTLTGIYFCLGFLRMLMCTMDDRYDFDIYYLKFTEHSFKLTAEESCILNGSAGSPVAHPAGAWICTVGSGREGAAQEYIDAMDRAVQYL